MKPRRVFSISRPISRTISRGSRWPTIVVGAVAFVTAAWGCAPTAERRPRENDDLVVEPDETKATETALVDPPPENPPPPPPSDAAAPVDSGVVAACDQKDGLAVYCMTPGGTYRTGGTIAYGPGFPEGLPALGLGAPGLGYVPATYPFTCEAKGMRFATSEQNVVGKICEAIFENMIVENVQGSAVYTVTAAPDAGPGDYPFGFQTNVGATALTPSFWLRVGAGGTPPN